MTLGSAVFPSMFTSVNLDPDSERPQNREQRRGNFGGKDCFVPDNCLTWAVKKLKMVDISLSLRDPLFVPPIPSIEVPRLSFITPPPSKILYPEEGFSREPRRNERIPVSNDSSRDGAGCVIL